MSPSGGRGNNHRAFLLAAHNLSIRRKTPLLSKHSVFDAQGPSWRSRVLGECRWSWLRLLEGSTLPYRHVIRVLYVTLLGCGLMSLYHQLAVGLGVFGCSRSNLHSDECRTIRYFFISIPLLTRQVLCFSVAMLLFLWQLYSMWRFRRCIRAGNSSGTKVSRADLLLTLGHWKAAASKDIFTEVVQMLQDSVLVVLLLMLPSTVISTTAAAGPALTKQVISEQIQLMVDSCCPGDVLDGSCSSFCITGRTTHTPATLVSLGFLVYILAIIIFVPTSVWSPVFQQAAKKMKQRFAERLLNGPAVSLASLTLGGYQFALYVLTILSPSALGVRFLWEATMVINCAGLFVFLVLFLCTVPWAAVKRIPHQLSINARYLWGLASRNRRIALERNSAPLVFHCRHSLRYRQLVVLLCGLYGFGLEVDPGSGSWTLEEMWVLRITVVVLFYFSRDEEADFTSLEEGGAGFGLVVDARELHLALRSHLGGNVQTPRKVRKYKGTLFRMSETLAVSYRWHDESENIDGVGCINMTQWQLSQLAEAIECSQCLYIWLDCLSVPQSRGELKRKLLARMMSVYASSGTTLVLLSNESETDRYHQRVWTLQEYCSSPSLMVVTQPSEHEDVENGELAVKGSEARIIEQIRLEHIARQPSCVPVWLVDMPGVVRSMSNEDATTIWITFQELCDDLYCLNPSDTIRALYPLLWNHPAESEEELVQLMQLLQDVHGIDQRSQRDLLLATSRGADLIRMATKATSAAARSTPSIATAASLAARQEEMGFWLPGSAYSLEL